MESTQANRISPEQAKNVFFADSGFPNMSSGVLKCNRNTPTSFPALQNSGCSSDPNFSSLNAGNTGTVGTRNGTFAGGRESQKVSFFTQTQGQVFPVNGAATSSPTVVSQGLHSGPLPPETNKGGTGSWGGETVKKTELNNTVGNQGNSTNPFCSTSQVNLFSSRNNNTPSPSSNASTLTAAGSPPGDIVVGKHSPGGVTSESRGASSGPPAAHPPEDESGSGINLECSETGSNLGDEHEQETDNMDTRSVYSFRSEVEEGSSCTVNGSQCSETTGLHPSGTSTSTTTTFPRRTKNGILLRDRSNR